MQLEMQSAAIVVSRPPPGLEDVVRFDAVVDLAQRWKASSAKVAEMLRQLIAATESPKACGKAPKAVDTPPGLGADFEMPPGLPLPPALAQSPVAAPAKYVEDMASTNNSGTQDLTDIVSDTESEVSQPMPKTTLMVRNIPTEYTEEALLKEWPLDLGFDFFYLPRNNKGKANLGYCFLNFTTEAQAEAFRVRWNKNRLAHYIAPKRLNISLAEVQGLEENVRQLKEKPVGRMKARQCQPIIVRDGRHITLEEA